MNLNLAQRLNHLRARAAAKAARAALAMAAPLVVPATALAQGLPTVEDPSRGQGAGIFATAKNYGFDAVMFGGLFICAVGFLGVGWYSFAVYADIQKGRKTWTDFGATVVVGIILLVVMIWIITKATGIL